MMVENRQTNLWQCLYLQIEYCHRPLPVHSSYLNLFFIFGIKSDIFYAFGSTLLYTIIIVVHAIATPFPHARFFHA